MALKSWLASLKVSVAGVSGVHAPIHAGLDRYVTETVIGSGVSGHGGMVAGATFDSAETKQTFQPRPACVLARTGDTADTGGVDITVTQTCEAAPPPIETKSTRLVGQRVSFPTGAARSAARAYHAHHFNCRICIAAGRGNRYGERCAAGLALWNSYSSG